MNLTYPTTTIEIHTRAALEVGAAVIAGALIVLAVLIV